MKSENNINLKYYLRFNLLGNYSLTFACSLMILTSSFKIFVLFSLWKQKMLFLERNQYWSHSTPGDIPSLCYLALNGPFCNSNRIIMAISRTPNYSSIRHTGRCVLNHPHHVGHAQASPKEMHGYHVNDGALLFSRSFLLHLEIVPCGQAKPIS